MSKYTFTFAADNGIATASYWANDMMEATADFYEQFASAVIIMTESQAA